MPYRSFERVFRGDVAHRSVNFCCRLGFYRADLLHLADLLRDRLSVLWQDTIFRGDLWHPYTCCGKSFFRGDLDIRIPVTRVPKISVQARLREVICDLQGGSVLKKIVCWRRSLPAEGILILSKWRSWSCRPLQRKLFIHITIALEKLLS